jgi:hypothetical protein
MRRYKIGIYLVLISSLLLLFSCQNNKHPHLQHERLYQKLEREAIDTLLKYGKESYADSAYWYFYVYFGSSIIKNCGTADVNDIFTDSHKRRIIYQDLLLTKARVIPNSFLVYLSVTPLVQDSIVSCNMVEGQQLPHELLFNYKTNQFVQFVYDENSWMKVKDIDPIGDYNTGLKKILEEENFNPHPKFRKLLSEISRR